MNRFVFDASAAYEYLVRTPAGVEIEALIHDSVVLTSALMDIEVLSIARRNLRFDRISSDRCDLLIRMLSTWPINRIEPKRLIQLIWSLRDNLSAYDASYVAVACQYRAALLTLDRKLANAPDVPCAVVTF